MAESPFHAGTRPDDPAHNPLDKVAGNNPWSSRRTPPMAADEEGPILATVRPGNLKEELAKRSGNFVLSFGFPGSGKTTLHSFLMRYLMEGGPYKTEVVRRDHGEGADYETNRMITEWSREWRQGRFPESTPVGENEIRELSFEVQPMKGVRTPLEFSILEMSGEMMRTVIPSREQKPNLSRVIRDLAANERLNLVILLLVNPRVHENDNLFTSFMSYLDANLGGKDIRKRAKLGIVISDPEMALDYLKTYKPEFAHHAEFRGDLVEEFVASFAPQTYRIYKEWPDPRGAMMMRFHVGAIEDREGMPRLVTPDYGSATRLFDWLYLQFTGRRPGPTRWQRMWSWIRT